MLAKKTFFIILLLVGLGGLFYWFTKPEPCGDCELPQTTNDNPDIIRPGFPNADSIPVTHTKDNGVQTISGVLTLPDPCYSIEHTVDVKLPIPELVTIDITTPRSDQLCATVITDKEFTVTFNASDEAIITATLNGKDVTLFESKN